MSGHSTTLPERGSVRKPPRRCRGVLDISDPYPVVTTARLLCDGVGTTHGSPRLKGHV